MDEFVKKWNREKFHISCNYSCTISFLMKILLVKLNYFYIQYTSNSISKKQIVSQMWRLKRWWYLSKLLTITIISLILVTFIAVS